MNKSTLVTAIYYSDPLSVMGGRRWDFSYYKPSLFAISKLGMERVVVYHDKHQEPFLEAFVKEHNLDNFELKLVELENLPYYETIYKIKNENLESKKLNAEQLYGYNNRLHILCTSKIWFLTNTIEEYNIENDPVIWVDAGFFHHALFPESLGGIELARFDLNNYYPLKSTSKINPKLGSQLDALMRDQEKIYGYATQIIRLPLEWGSDVAPTLTIASLIGGMFGGLPPVVKSLSEKFYEMLSKILDANIVPLEEGILSVVHAQNPELFYLNTFDTWYHDVPTDPCYFLSGKHDLYSFYRSFFDLIENKETRLKENMVMDNGMMLPFQQEVIKYNKYDLPNIAVYGSHNASVAVEYNGKILEVVEIERFLNVKNAGYAQYYVASSRPYLSKLLLDYFQEKYGFTEYGYCLHQHCETLEDDTRVLYWKQFPAKHYIECKHHESHAAGVFYQSPFKKALIISFDGGGNDGFFKIYLAEKGKPLNLLKDYRTDLGFPYMIFGEYLKDIKKEVALNLGNLVYSGKILGLQSYGEPVQEWIEHFKELYLSRIDGTTYQSYIDELGEKIGVKFDIENRLTGDIEYKVAATSQAAFEEIFFEYVDEIIKDHPDIPICISGGCALNIVLNTKIKKHYNREVFVGPNPNDCGLAVGMLANMVMPEEQIDITYGGPEILDKNKLGGYIERYTPLYYGPENLAKELKEGKIVGLVQGRSEHGPRALGNRSIICNPLISDMKDKLNFKVKHREWYRPFAPVVRLEDVSEYFEWGGESRWMSFCPKVKENYLDVMPAIVHIDKTARVQTVTRDQNPFLYDLLTQFKKLTGIGVLLNTSFNVDGKPILSTLEDAFHVWKTTELDALHIFGFYFDKKT